MINLDDPLESLPVGYQSAMLKLLSSSSDDTKAWSTTCLATLSVKEVDARRLMLLGGLEILLKLHTTSPSPTVQQNTLQAIYCCCWASPDALRHLRKIGGYGPMITALTAQYAETALHLFRSITFTVEGCIAVRELNGVPVLCSLLSERGESIMDQAAAVLCGMAELDMESAEQIAKSPEILELLANYLASDSMPKKKSAVKIAAFASKIEIARVHFKKNSLLHIAALLSDSSFYVQFFAALAIAFILGPEKGNIAASIESEFLPHLSLSAVSLQESAVLKQLRHFVQTVSFSDNFPWWFMKFSQYLPLLQSLQSSVVLFALWLFAILSDDGTYHQTLNNELGLGPFEALLQSTDEDVKVLSSKVISNLKSPAKPPKSRNN